MTGRRGGVVLRLGLAQTLAWASSYYLPAMLAGSMARDLGLTVPTVFAGFSAALVISALVGPAAGRAIDRHGGRTVLALTNLVFAAGLAGLGLAGGPVVFFAAWLLIGVGMGAGLYDAAFATLVRLDGPAARGTITGITLIAGFASTVGWPVTTLLDAQFGWRGACFTWAALHLLAGLPLNLGLPAALPAPQPSIDTSTPPADAPATPSRFAGPLLAFVFAGTWFISTAMAAHLPRLLQLGGASLAAAVAAGALVGPAQVAGRLLEYGVLRRVHPLISARLASVMHPLGVAVLALAGPAGAGVFALLHGAGNGILTIAKGTLPLVLFGPAGYGHRQGVLMVPARVAQAFAPWAFGVAMDLWGLRALGASAAVAAMVAVALVLLRARDGA